MKNSRIMQNAVRYNLCSGIGNDVYGQKGSDGRTDYVCIAFDREMLRREAAGKLSHGIPLFGETPAETLYQLLLKDNGVYGEEDFSNTARSELIRLYPRENFNTPKIQSIRFMLGMFMSYLMEDEENEAKSTPA